MGGINLKTLARTADWKAAPKEVRLQIQTLDKDRDGSISKNEIPSQLLLRLAQGYLNGKLPSHRQTTDSIIAQEAAALLFRTGIHNPEYRTYWVAQFTELPGPIANSMLLFLDTTHHAILASHLSRHGMTADLNHMFYGLAMVEKNGLIGAALLQAHPVATAQIQESLHGIADRTIRSYWQAAREHAAAAANKGHQLTYRAFATIPDNAEISDGLPDLELKTSLRQAAIALHHAKRVKFWPATGNPYQCLPAKAQQVQNYTPPNREAMLHSWLVDALIPSDIHTGLSDSAHSNLQTAIQAYRNGRNEDAFHILRCTGCPSEMRRALLAEYMESVTHLYMKTLVYIKRGEAHRARNEVDPEYLMTLTPQTGEHALMTKLYTLAPLLPPRNKE